MRANEYQDREGGEQLEEVQINATVNREKESALLLEQKKAAVIKESMILAETRGIHGTIPTELGHCTSLGTGLKIFFMTILDLSKYFLGIVWKFN